MQAACSAVLTFATASGPRFRMCSLGLGRSLLPGLGHAHARVRSDAIEAVAAVLLHGDPALLDECVPALATRAADHAAAVRKALYSSAGLLLVAMPDRCACHDYGNQGGEKTDRQTDRHIDRQVDT